MYYGISKTYSCLILSTVNSVHSLVSFLSCKQERSQDDQSGNILHLLFTFHAIMMNASEKIVR